MAEEQKRNVLDVARKKRHIHLLEKIQKNKTLSLREIEELEQYEKGERVTDGLAKTQDEVAAAFGVSPRAVKYWVQDGMPRCSNGEYDLMAIKNWRIERKQKLNEPDSEKSKEEARYRKFKADLIELEYKEKCGKLIAVDEVERGRVERILVIKTALLALPTRVVPKLYGRDMPDMEAILSEHIEEIIAEFSKDDHAEPDTSDSKNGLVDGGEERLETS